MIKIVPLQKEHVEKIVELETKYLLETLGVEMIMAEMHNKYAHFLTALDDDLVIGYIGGWIIDDVLEVINFVVDEAYQRKGIGTLLINTLTSIQKVKEIILEVRSKNQKAINFYTKLGFIEINRRLHYYKNGDDALVLRKEIV